MAAVASQITSQAQSSGSAPLVHPPAVETSFVNGFRLSSLTSQNAQCCLKAVNPSMDQELASSSTRSRGKARSRPVEEVRADLLTALHQQAISEGSMQSFASEYYFWIPSMIKAEDLASFNAVRVDLAARIDAASAPIPAPVVVDEEDSEDEELVFEGQTFAPLVFSPDLPRVQIHDLPVASAFAMPGASTATSAAPAAGIFLSGMPTSQNMVSEYIYSPSPLHHY